MCIGILVSIVLVNVKYKTLYNYYYIINGIGLPIREQAFCLRYDTI